MSKFGRILTFPTHASARTLFKYNPCYSPLYTSSYFLSINYNKYSIHSDYDEHSEKNLPTKIFILWLQPQLVWLDYTVVDYQLPGLDNT